MPSSDRMTLASWVENAGQFGAQEAHPLPHRNPARQQESAYLIDDGGALAEWLCGVTMTPPAGEPAPLPTAGRRAF
jgi:hypothetical protein